jgi:phage tail sheath protein FI
MAQTPGTVRVEEISNLNGVTTINNVTSVAAFVGSSDRGPTVVDDNSFIVGVPTLVTSFEDFKTYFSYGSTSSNTDIWSNATDLKYAVKSFFDNGGGQAYVVRDIVATDAAQTRSSLRDQNASLTQGSVNWTFATATASNQLTITAASGTPFANLASGTAIDFAGITATGFTFLNTGDWVVKTNTNTVTTLVWTGASDVATATQASGITVAGAANSATISLVVTAKDHGAWGNTIWVGVYPNSGSNLLFDLIVYYSTAATTYNDLNIDAANTKVVERWYNLSMNSDDTNYFAKIINSNWVTVTLGNTTATSTTRFRLPVFTGTWSLSTTSANISAAGSGDGTLTYNVQDFTKTAIKLGTTVTANATAVVSGSNGTQNTDLDKQLARLDGVSGPLVFNFPNITTLTNVNKILAYAAGRSDAFAVIDSANDTVTNVLTTVNTYSQSNAKYGALYYPQISVGDSKYPGSSNTKTIPPGGAVVAIYVSTDVSRGVYKAPAGTNAVVKDAVSVKGISTSDYSKLNNNPVSINIIKQIPGAGFCVMGTRTLSSVSTDRYVPVRRSIIYLGKQLSDLTAQFVFEPNTQKLWDSVNSAVNGFLYKFWTDGGLAGSTAQQAFYVKCNSTNNTSNSINNGELNIEVGVALTRPAEFIIIKIGQTNSGAYISTVG